MLEQLVNAYDIRPVQPGALALALIIDPNTGAARALKASSGLSNEQLIDRIQSDIIGVTLWQEDLGDVSERERFENFRRLGRVGRIAAFGAVLLAIMVAVGSLSATLGKTIGSVAAFLGLLALLLYVQHDRKRQKSSDQSSPVRRSINRCIAAFCPPTDYSAKMAICLGLYLLLLSWLVQLTLLSKEFRIYEPLGDGRAYISRVSLRWIRDNLETATFGSVLIHPYWPLMVASAGLVSGYFIGSAVQIFRCCIRGVWSKGLLSVSALLIVAFGVAVVMFSVHADMPFGRSIWLDRSYSVACPGLADQPFAVSLDDGVGRATGHGGAYDLEVDVNVGNGLAVGNVLNDERSETAVTLWCHPADSGTTYGTNEVQIFSDADGKPKLLDRLTLSIPSSPFPPLFISPGLHLSKGVLESAIQAWAPGDCHACASINRTLLWHWDGHRFAY
jgi:hypothetical protein